MAGPYRQHIPELDLSLEHQTARAPDRRGYFLFRGDRQLGRYPSLPAARAAWRDVVKASGWTPAKRDVDASEVMRRVSGERWARNRAG
jgi:hypothetical protein